MHGKAALFAIVIFTFAFGISYASYYPNANLTGGFYNGSEVEYVYTGNYTCYPALATSNSSLAQVANSYPCYSGIQTAQSQALPDWQIIPAYAGISIFGKNSSGGMPKYRNATVYVNCGAGNSTSMCDSDPEYGYSPEFAAIERTLNITSFEGKPFGVMPLPAHSHIVNNTFNGDPIPWYVIDVYVFDPNIMPNATTGRCSQIVSSNVSDPTANCLTSANAVELAAGTYDNATANANADNPVWIALGSPRTEVYIPGYGNNTRFGLPNTNVVVPFAVKAVDFYSNSSLAKKITTTTIVTKPKMENTFGYGAALVIAIAIAVAILYKMRISKYKQKQ